MKAVHLGGAAAQIGQHLAAAVDRRIADRLAREAAEAGGNVPAAPPSNDDRCAEGAAADADAGRGASRSKADSLRLLSVAVRETAPAAGACS